ncbi:MAG TPA: signal peptidase I [Pyrinomonadaceae bacterium]|nr:signal peptidase I [Pyrinomonadaceae bacterium]
MASVLKGQGEEREESAAETPDEHEERAEEEEAGPPRSLLREYFESGVVPIIMALFFMTFVAQAAEVPSASMENTIFVGDRFLINKFIFAPGTPLPFLPQREIRRGDIIVFKYPSDINTNKEVVRYKTLFIKRVIGLPGEIIEVRGSNVYADGKLLPEYRVTARDPQLGNDDAELKDLSYPAGERGEPYTVYYSEDPERAASMSDFPNAVKRPYKIPDNEYFVMGDNRDNSTDSRAWGTVPRQLVVGRAMFVIWSYDSSAPRSDGRFGFLSDFFNNTRWGRTGTLIK